MKRILGLIILLLLGVGAHAQTPTTPAVAAMVCANSTVVPTPIAGQFFYVQCDSNGKLITTASSTAAGITIGTSVITGGTDTRVLFDDAGKVGESNGFTYTKANGLVQSTLLAVGGATIGANAFAITGSSAFNGAETINLNAAAPIIPVTGTALHVIGADGVNGRVQSTSFGTIASFTAARANGTGASPTAVVSGNQIGGVNAYSYVTSASPGFVGPVASYQTFATENHTTTAMGSKAVVATTPNGSTTLTTALTVDQDQSATLVGRLTAAGITNTASGAASVSSEIFTGTLFTGGTGTTTFPQLYINATGTTAPTTLATGGTYIGVNSLSGFGGNYVDFYKAGVRMAFIDNSGNIRSSGGGLFADGGNVQTASTGAYIFSGRGLITSPAVGAVQFGAADAAVAVAQTTRVQSVVAGTAAANGANWTLIGSLPTGTGTSGDIIVQTGVKTGSGTTQGTPTTALTIKGETQAIVTSALDSSTSAGGALQVAGGASVAKRFWIPAITASSGLQTAVLCQSSGGEMIADSVACLASSARYKDIRGSLSNDIIGKFMKLPIKIWAYKEEGIFKKGNWTRDRIGPIAEDVEKLDPRLVEYDRDGQVRAYSTEQLLAYTIKVVQEQQAQIDGLLSRQH